MLSRILACVIVTFCYVGGVSAATWSLDAGRPALSSATPTWVELLEGSGTFYADSFAAPTFVPSAAVGEVFSTPVIAAGVIQNWDVVVQRGVFPQDFVFAQGGVFDGELFTSNNGILNLTLDSSERLLVSLFVAAEPTIPLVSIAWTTVDPAGGGGGGGVGSSPIPLPAAGWMLLAGLGALATAARRRAA